MKFATGNHHVALIKTLTQTCGPPLHFDGCSAATQALLFIDYITYEGEEKFIFLHQVLKKCFDLSNSDWKVFSFLVNSVECE